MNLKMKLLATIALTLPLAGCYLGSSVPLVGSWGERIALASKLWCTSDNDSTSLYTVREVRTDNTPNRFNYVVTDENNSSLTLVFRELKSPGDYLVQVEFGPSTESSPTFIYGTYDESQRTFAFISSGFEEVALLAKPYDVEISSGGTIEGTYPDLKLFFSELKHPADSQLTCIGIL